MLDNAFLHIPVRKKCVPFISEKPGFYNKTVEPCTEDIVKVVKDSRSFHDQFVTNWTPMKLLRYCGILEGECTDFRKFSLGRMFIVVLI